MFHFGVPGFGGGFAGVDVFFVISGYLMTGIIVSGLSQGSFSVLAFYLARARRIVPALLVVCLAVLGIGWFFLPPMDFSRLGSHAAAAAVFISNIRFSREAGYFDIEAHEKLLLHTWSLSVEWQFYLVLPLVLMAAFRAGRGVRWIPATLLLALLASLLASILLTPKSPSAAFYLLPTRAWEMAAGGLVYWLAARVRLGQPARKAIESIGLGLIVLSVAMFDAASPWPGWRAGLPVLGAALVILAARSDSAWTGNWMAQRLGESSYSIYLWHWPVVVVWGYFAWLGVPAALVAGIAVSLLLGALSYRWIEVPSKGWLTRISGGAALRWMSAGVIGVVAVAYGVKAAEGVPGRMPEQVLAIFAQAQNGNPRAAECVGERDKPVPGCTYGGPKLGALVLGDSHAAAVVRAVEKSLPSPDLHVLDWTVAACPTVLGIRSRGVANERCSDFVEWAVKRQADLPPGVPVLMVNRSPEYVHGPNEPDRAKDLVMPRWFVGTAQAAYNAQHIDSMLAAMNETACAIAKTRPVYLLRPIPELALHVPNVMARAKLQGRDTNVSIPLAEYQERNREIWSAQDEVARRCGVHILDPIPVLCRGGKCSGAQDGLPIYVDDDHLNQRGAELLLPLFQQMFADRARAESR